MTGLSMATGKATRAKLTLAYDGSALQDGRMEVRDLAPALLGLGQLFESANRVCNGDRTRVSITVGAPSKPGSYPIDLQVIATVLDSVKQVLGMIDLKDAQELAKIVFGGGGVVGLIALIKKKAGRKVAKAEDQADGTVNLTLQDSSNVTVTVNVQKEVYVLSEDAAARTGVDRIARPLRSPGVQVLEMRRGRERTKLIESEDVPALAMISDDDADGSVVSDSERETVVVVDRPHFHRGHRWGLSLGRTEFGADILDEAFLDAVDRREFVFGKGDALRVLLRERVTRDADGRIKGVHQVLKVIEIIPPRGQQTRLLDL